MNIIFLDIDGVLVHENYIVSVYPNIKRDRFGKLFCPIASSLLNELIEKTNAKIVITSSWRADGLKDMQTMWKERNMSGEVIDVTPYFYVRDTIHMHKPSMPRGVEIDYWLHRNNYMHHEPDCIADYETIKKCKIKNYIIIDDDTDMLWNQRNNFIRCNEMEGFTFNDFQKALKILK